MLNVTLVRQTLFDSVGTNASVVLTLISVVHATIGVRRHFRTEGITQCNASSSSRIAKFFSQILSLTKCRGVTSVPSVGLWDSRLSIWELMFMPNTAILVWVFSVPFVFTLLPVILLVAGVAIPTGYTTASPPTLVRFTASKHPRVVHLPPFPLILRLRPPLKPF